MNKYGSYILSNLPFFSVLTRTGTKEENSILVRKHYLKKVNLPVIILLLILSCNNNSFAQFDMGLPLVSMSASVSSYSLGFQSVALMNGDDALSYNPANLVYTKGSGFNYFSSSSHSDLSGHPFYQTEAFVNYPSYGTFALQYRKNSWEKFVGWNNSSPDMNMVEVDFDSYSLGFARRFNNSVSAGLELKYVQIHMPGIKSNNFAFSAGINYEPMLFGRQLKLSLSLMNLSSTFKTEGPLYDTLGNIIPGKRVYYDDPPTELNLGIYGSPIDNSFMEVSAQLALSKLISEQMPNGNIFEGQSSFKTLFTDWQDFPGDAALHSGLIFKLKPVNLGGNFQFFQNFYLGNYSRGIKAGASGAFTHGAEAGINSRYLKLSVGYTGLWYRVQTEILRTYPQVLPNESFQVSFGLNSSAFSTPDVNNSGSDLTAVYLSAGAAIPLFQDNLTVIRGTSVDSKRKGNPGYSLSAAFYFTRKSAVVTELSYRRVTEDTKASYTYFQLPGVIHVKLRNETVSFSSAYRYHPAESLQPLYVEGGIGILRVNPLENTNPKYYYRPIFKIAAGYMQAVTKNLYISPELSYRLVPTYTHSYQSDPYHPYEQAIRMGGFNQINAGLQAGYRL